jgi:23S rRNA pseudouridine955/2504/2580 synthase
MRPLEVLFENDACLVLNKPAGLPVQGGRGVRTSLDSLLAAGWSPRPLLVHRLDRDTSGLILAAKGPVEAARFSRLLAGRQVAKRYLAVCRGRPLAAAGIIELELEVRGAIRPAETRYQVRSASPARGPVPACALLELELGTGRMHQIRRHLARIGCPVLGDDKYGDFPLNRLLRKEAGLGRLLLHAFRLIIPGELDAAAPLPEYFRDFCAGAGLALDGLQPAPGYQSSKFLTNLLTKA